MKTQYIAHLRETDNTPQHLWTHLQNVSEIAGKFAASCGLKEHGQVIGLLHDLGKASWEFQKYICSAVGIIDPDSDDYEDPIAKKGKIDHSSAGAQILYRYFSERGPEGQLAAQFLSLCIASHHSGLIDCLAPNGENNFLRRIEKSEDLTHYSEAWNALEKNERKEIDALLSAGVEKKIVDVLNHLKEKNDSKATFIFKCGLLIRFLFSCLIDADRLDTANFESPKDAQLRNVSDYRSWETLIERFGYKLREFENKKSKNEIDELRDQVSQACLGFSAKPKGIYQLKVPTGGGKTLASLRFALNHAAHHKMERIIYVIPYTSIIDQNADEVRKILEDKDDAGKYVDKVVLEHHSNLTPEEESRRHNLLAENWDAPVIFTTQVQFLEALFGHGTRSARRMHQLANAVIIFDEIQTIPVRCVHLFNVALRFLVQGCGSTVVLCTATQPLLDKIEPIHYALSIQPEQRMIPNEEELYKKLRRVEVHDSRKIGGWSDEEVADLTLQELQVKGSALVIVNTRNAARSLYQAISAKTNLEIYHLSTNMCPAHRLKILGEIKERLMSGSPVICVSTQLIEAGVDIDFGSVIRYIAGLDSIVQAAGRCNRSGRRNGLGNVWIVNPTHENLDKLQDIGIGIDVSNRLLDEYRGCPEVFDNDILGLGMISSFYNYYFYERRNEMKYPVGKKSPIGREDDIFNLLSTNTLSVAEYQRIAKSDLPLVFRQSFQAAAKSFEVIDSFKIGVIAPFQEEGKKIIEDLCGAFGMEKEHRLLRRAQRYSVNLLPYEFKKLMAEKAISEIRSETGIFYLDKQYYSDQFGWCDEAVNGMEFLICEGGDHG